MELTGLSLILVVCCCVGQSGANIDGEFCVDVSTYTEIEWEEGDECCKQGVGEPLCSYRSGPELCLQVNETKCHLELADRVEMEPCPVNETMVEQERETFQPYDVKMVPHTFYHLKYNFTCENRTRQNCVTNWVENEEGEKVRDPIPGSCENVTWLDCHKTPYNASFVTMKHEKVPLNPIPYNKCREVQMVNKQMCWYVKKVAVPVCEIIQREICKPTTEKWCQPTLGERKCSLGSLLPSQQREHKDKCLLPEEMDHHSGHQNTYQHEASAIDLRSKDKSPTVYLPAYQPTTYRGFINNPYHRRGGRAQSRSRFGQRLQKTSTSV